MAEHEHEEHSHKVELAVVVNGQRTEVEVNPEAALRSVVARALEETGNAGQPAENWELRDAAGDLLDLDRTVESFAFAAGTTLFLNLKAGIGG